jgi:hypothetical protein
MRYDFNSELLRLQSIEIPEEIPDKMPRKTSDDPFDVESFDSPNLLHDHVMREKYVDAGMYGFVSWRWVNPFVKWIGKRKVLEVMAGRGWLAHALRLKGVDIIATDNFSWAKNRGWKEPLTEVEELDAVESVIKYGKDIDILIISWPYMDSTAYEVIKKLYEVNPSALVVYIGEGEGGCTADDLFFDHFEEIEDESFSEVEKNYERWWGIHDWPFLGRYSPTKVE